MPAAKGWPFKVTIPGNPPSVNHMYEQHGGRKHKAPGVEQYQLDAYRIARSAKPSGPAPEGQLRVLYWFYLPGDPDVDNRFKALNDSLALAIGVNDKVFVPCVAEMNFGCPLPEVRVTVQIGPIEPRSQS
jgi:Holliday junction resolvase RusA-like endonuclease